MVNHCPFDWAYTILLLPVLFFPVPMGHTAAWLAEIFSIPTYGGFCFCASILGCLAAIILNLFGYRLNVIVPKAHVLSLTKLGHAYMSVAVAAFCIICVAIALIDTTADQADAISWVTREYTCAEPALSTPRLYIFLLHKMKRVVVLGAAGGVLIIFLCITSVILSFHFLPKNGQLSQKTKVMQRRFLVYLCVQASLPTVYLVIPILILLYSMAAAVDIAQGFANILMFSLGLHGTISSITIVLCNEPYRKFITSFLPTRWWRKQEQTGSSRYS
ncbi:hypothetical protein Q1695_011535 [Nippostrongylus brasiliensis]|nr:hypothetical protein Q1695_011535 [Nippostrongylus brasiliensis]